MYKRFFVAGVLIAGVTAAAVVSVIVLQAQIWGAELRPIDPKTKRALVPAPPGEPQTIMLLGSDRRYADIQRKAPGRSDTIILVRLDPDRDVTAVMSIPRDLKVKIPAKDGTVEDKINAAYSLGGSELTIRTVRKLLGIPIHHVVDVNFGGFRRIVNRLGCFYQDVDRTYFNDNAPPNGSVTPYATIDVKAGYQLMCGQDSLDWARFRHLDDDFVRAGRQQEFIRQAKGQVSASSIIDDREELLRIFGRHTRTDIDPKNVPALFGLLKLGYHAAQQPLRQVRFRAGEAAGGTFLTASQEGLDATRREFTSTTKPKRQGGAPPRPAPRRERPARGSLASGLVNDRTGGEDHALDLAVKAGFPVYYPQVRLNRGGYVADGPRRYSLRTRDGRLVPAYRIVLAQGEPGQYYGVQGLKWRNPPILDEAHDKQKLRGRTYRVYYDGNRIRMVAWKTPTGSYWVSNTLSQRLTNRQMLDIAKCLTRVGL